MKFSLRQIMFGAVLMTGLTTVGMASCTQKSTEENNNECKAVESTAVESTPQDAPKSSEQKVAKVVNADEFQKMTTDSNTVIIDVRTPQEYNSGHIKGAVNMNVYENFEQKIQGLEKGKTYLIYCRSGGRSNSAMQTMKAAGFTNLYDLRGGIGAWQASGKPVE